MKNGGDSAPLLEPGLCLTLRPMAYPRFFEMYKAAIKNTWTVEEVDFSGDLMDRVQDGPGGTAPRPALGGFLCDR